MAPVTKKYYRRKKRVYRRKRRYNRRYTRLPASSKMNTKGPLPRTFKGHLRYTDSISLNPGAGTLASHTFNMSSLYDPDYTATGHQPLGFDQIMPMYDHFVVIGSKLTATIAGSGGFSVPTAVCLNLDPDVSTASTVEQAMEQNSSKYTILNGENRVKTITMNYSPKKFMGISKPMSSDKLQGTISANPSDNAFCTIYAQAVDGSSDPGAIDIVVTIDYVAVFIEPITLAQS